MALAESLVSLQSDRQSRTEYGKRGLANVRNFGLMDYVVALEAVYAGRDA
jgi:hypothetical protein